MAIFLAPREEAEKAYKDGALQEGTVIPEFEAEKEESE
jgi:hypothetical protein